MNETMRPFADANNARNRELALYEMGYRYKLTPTDNSFESLLVKSSMDVGPALREYPDKRFIVETANPHILEIGDGNCVDTCLTCHFLETAFNLAINTYDLSEEDQDVLRTKRPDGRYYWKSPASDDADKWILITDEKKLGDFQSGVRPKY